MIQISTTSFSAKNITTEYAVVQQAITGDAGLLGIVLAMRGLDAGNATRELRVFIDGITIDGVSTNDVPANQADSFFSETHGATATRLSVVVAGVRNGQTVDVRVKSSNSSDTSVSGTCEVLSLDEFTGSQATSVVSDVHLAKAAAVNKQIQTITTGVVEIKDDDGTTTLKTLTPSVDNQDAPTQNILTPS